MDSISFSKIRSPKVRLNPPAGEATDFPLDIAGILALIGFSELLGMSAPVIMTQLTELDSGTVLHWSQRENAELLAWLQRLVADGSITEIRVEFDLPDGGTLTISRDVRQEWSTLHDWLTRNEA